MLSRPLLLTLALAVATGARLAAQAADGGSPFFAPVAGNAPAAGPSEGAPLELRGIIQDARGYRFSIFNPAKHASAFARLNDAGGEFVIKSHDAEKDMVTVDYQGRSFTLGLKVGKIQAGGPAPALMPAPGGGNTALQGPVVMNPSPADEARRLEVIAEEVRRRRAMREAGAQAMNGPGGIAIPPANPQAAQFQPPAPQMTPPPQLQLQQQQQQNRRQNRRGQQP